MIVDVANILKSIGPAASIIFAAWIFMGFVQQRYDAAFGQYREVIALYREDDVPDVRRTNVRDQVLAYKHRCELMARATMLGLFAAVLLITTLVAGELDIIFPHSGVLGYVSAGSALLGFLLVIAAAVVIILENRITFRQLESEVLDVPDLADGIGQRAGKITDSRRGLGQDRMPEPAVRPT